MSKSLFPMNLFLAISWKMHFPVREYISKGHMLSRKPEIQHIREEK